MHDIDEKNVFLGTGWSFPPGFRKDDKEIEMVSYEQDIKESLHILLSTSPGERVMHPAFGSDIQKMVFETVTESLITRIEDSIERAILFFEPRITVQNIQVKTEADSREPDSIYHGVLPINIEYIIRRTNTRSNIVYPFYFLEGSNVSV